MLVSLLLRSFSTSVLGRAWRKLGVPKLVRTSITYRLLITSYEVLSTAAQSSIFLRIIRRTCSYVSTLTSGISKIAPRWGIGLPIIRRLIDILLSPWMLPLGFLLFFWSSMVRVSTLTMILIYSTVLVMALGILLAYKEEDLRVIDNKGLVIFLGVVMFLLGYIAFIMQVSRVGGLPLLNDELRRGLSPILNYLAWTTVPGTAFLLSSLKLRRCEAYSLALIGFIPSFFLAFRTEMIAYILMALVVLYHRKMINYKQVFLGLLMAAAFFLGVGAIRSLTTGLAQNPLLSVLYRPTITIAALDTIVRLYAFRPVTGGWVHLAALSSLGLIRGSRYGPRTLISIYVGGRRTVSTTATLIGGPLLDWGILGAVVVSLVFSYLLALAYRFSKKADYLLGPYSVLFAYLIVGIETGILDLNIYIYLLLAVMVLLTSLRPEK